MSWTWNGKGPAPPPENAADPCPACNGVGERDVEQYSHRTKETTWVWKTCPDCSGSGNKS